MDTSTAPAAPATADANSGASSASTPAVVQTTAQRMAARAAELSAAARAPSTPEAPPAAPAAVTPAGVAPPTEGEEAPADAVAKADEQKEEPKKTEKLIPHSVLTKRLGEVAAKRDAAIAGEQKAKLEAAQLRAALQAAAEEVEHWRTLNKQGTQLDPRDVQLYDHDVDRRVAEQLAKVRQEHEAEVQRYAAEQREALAVERHRQKLEGELEKALSSYSLVDRDSLLIAAEKRPNASLVEIARDLDTRLRQRLSAAGFSPAQSTAPVVETVRAPGGAPPSTGRHANNATGMLAWMRDQQARNQGL